MFACQLSTDVMIDQPAPKTATTETVRPADPARVARLGAALTRLHYAARRTYSTDLSHQSIRVLQLLAMSATPPRVDDVARHLGAAASTASELLKRLQRKGLAERRRSAADERVVEVRLTEAGRAALDEHTSMDPAKLATLLGRLPEAEQATLTALVEGLTDACAQDGDP